MADFGLYADGHGLYLQIRHGGAKSWILRYTRNGRTRDKGLGSLADVSLVLARGKAAQCRALLAQDIDPIEQAKADRQVLPATKRKLVAHARTFREAAETYMDEKLKRFRSATHREQWRYTLETFAYPVLGDMDVAAIDTPHVLQVLRPIWETKCETAMRLRGRIERILARAAVEGHRASSNPAVWRGHLQEALPSRSEVNPVVHHPALPVGEMPAFMLALEARPDLSAAALKFLILTATRTGETTGARWCEIDRAAATWTIPGFRTKSGRDHTVPLSTGALAVLDEMVSLKSAAGGFIFQGRDRGGISTFTMLALLQKRMGRAVTCHGFRSTFRDWCGDIAGVPPEIAEAALAHVVEDQTERAYRRGTAIERRREVMQRWCDFCGGFPTATIVPFKAVG